MSDSHLLPFRDRHPILKQAVVDAGQLTWTQIGVPAGLAVSSFIVQMWNDYDAHHLAFGAGAKTLLYSLLLGMALYVLVAAIRAPFVVIGRQHRQLADLRQQLGVELTPTGSTKALPGKIDAPIYTTNPDLEYTDHEIAERWLSLESGLTHEKPDDEGNVESAKVRIVLARFYYKPERGVPPSIYVRAHISIANSEGTPIKTRYDAVWEKEPESEYKQFETTDSHKLIIVLLSDEPEKGIVTFQHDERDGEFYVESTPLAGQDFRLQLDLVGKHQNDPVLNKSLKFSLVLDPRPELKLLPCPGSSLS